MSYDCNPKPYNANDVTSWGYFKPTIIAHDVGRSRDRSTAVIGGKSPAPPELIGIGELIELPRGLYGSPRAYELAQIDNRYANNALIVADLSNDPTYAEPLHKLFGPRLIGLHITHRGEGMEPVRRPVNSSAILIYTIGRSVLFEQLHSLLETGEVRFPPTEMMRRAFAQLHALETEWRNSGTTYQCPEGQHDDLAVSCAMLAWAAHHAHLEHWVRAVQTSHRPAPRVPKIGARAWS